MAGSWLLPPTRDEHVMPNDHFQNRLQDRLRVRFLGDGEAKHCKHCAAQSGTLCGVSLDARGHHARSCKVGGDVVRGHNNVRDLLATWIQSVTGRKAWTVRRLAASHSFPSAECSRLPNLPPARRPRPIVRTGVTLVVMFQGILCFFLQTHHT